MVTYLGLCSKRQTGITVAQEARDKGPLQGLLPEGRSLSPFCSLGKACLRVKLIVLLGNLSPERRVVESAEFSQLSYLGVHTCMRVCACVRVSVPGNSLESEIR